MLLTDGESATVFETGLKTGARYAAGSSRNARHITHRCTVGNSAEGQGAINGAETGLLNRRGTAYGCGFPSGFNMSPGYCGATLGYLASSAKSLRYVPTVLPSEEGVE